MREADSDKLPSSLTSAVVALAPVPDSSPRQADESHVAMDLFRRVSKIIPTETPRLPSADEKGRRGKGRGLASRLAFFRRPMRLKGNSSISVPLGVVLLFPCFVVILILVLFLRHPDSPGRRLMPAGAPPAIRYVSTLSPRARGLTRRRLTSNP